MLTLSLAKWMSRKPRGATDSAVNVSDTATGGLLPGCWKMWWISGFGDIDMPDVDREGEFVAVCVTFMDPRRHNSA